MTPSIYNLSQGHKAFSFTVVRWEEHCLKMGIEPTCHFWFRESPRLRRICLYTGKRRLENLSSSFLANKGKRESWWITCCSCWLTSSHGWGVRNQMTSYLLGIGRYSLCRSGQSLMCDVGLLGPGSWTGIACSKSAGLALRNRTCKRVREVRLAQGRSWTIMQS